MVASGRWRDRVEATLARESEVVWHRASRSVPVRAILRTAVLLAIAAVVVQSVAHLVDTFALDARYDLINADLDTGVFTWASSAATFAAAMAVALLAALVPSRRIPLLALASGIGLFSLDDAVALHERITIDHIGPIPHASRILWVLVLLPVLACVFVGLATIAWRAPREIARVLAVALALLVGAVLLEAGTPALFEAGEGHRSIPYETEVVVEEGAELAAWLLVAGALGAGVVVLAAAGSSAREPGRDGVHRAGRGAE
jgi:hypothetical protein